MILKKDNIAFNLNPCFLSLRHYITAVLLTPIMPFLAALAGLITHYADQVSGGVVQTNPSLIAPGFKI